MLDDDSISRHTDDSSSDAPSSQLLKLDSVYKSGGEEAARQLMENQPMEEVAV